MKIKVRDGKAIIGFSETTLREIVSAVQEAKRTIQGQETVRVRSNSQDIGFEIYLETSPNTQESLGYKISG